MPETNNLINSQCNGFFIQNTMHYSCAIYMVCSGNNICRRKKWGNTVTHIYAEACENGGHILLHVNKSGGLSYYIPSIEDLLAKDWAVL